MTFKFKIIFLALISCMMIFMIACDDSNTNLKTQPANQIISKTIPKIVVKKDNKQVVKNNTINSINKSKVEVELENKDLQSEEQADKTIKEHYDSQGKIDPFTPLIQETPRVVTPVVDPRPERVLTPLEKIELSQIRLVAVIIMENKSIAMVEESTGKGYEIGIGTYIGKNQGKVFKINSSSIVVKELIRDYKGRLKERVQEIKLHKMDEEG